MARLLGAELAAALTRPIRQTTPWSPSRPWSETGGLAEQIDAVRRSIGLAAEASGSNNWAVSGALSATGTPLIAGDPHLPPTCRDLVSDRASRW